MDYQNWGPRGISAPAKAELPEHKKWFDRHGWVHTWFVPFTTWIWLITLISAAFTDTIHWRGNRYKLARTARSTGDSLQ